MKFLKKFTQLKQGSLAKNAAWVFAGQVMSLVLQAAYFVLLARLLGSSEYGLVAGAFATASIVAQYSSLGSGYVFLRHVSPDRSLFPAYWGNIIISTVSLGSLLICLLWLFGDHIIASNRLPLLLTLAVSECIFAKLSVSAGQVFMAFEKMRFTALLNLLANALRLTAAIILTFTTHHVSAEIWTRYFLAVSVVACIAAVTTVTLTMGKPIFNFVLFWQRLGESFVFTLSSSAMSAYNDIDKSMMLRYGMNQANGIYSMSYRAINIATMPVYSIYTAAYPRFFQLGKGGVRATIPLTRKLLKRTVPFGLASAICLYLAAPLIPLIVGKDFAESVNALRWLCLLPLLRAVSFSAGDAIAGSGYQPVLLTAQILTAVLNFCLNLYLIPHYGWHGAAYASLAADGALAILNWTFLAILLSWKGKTRGDSAAPPIDPNQLVGPEESLQT